MDGYCRADSDTQMSGAPKSCFAQNRHADAPETTLVSKTRRSLPRKRYLKFNEPFYILSFAT